MKVLSCAGLLSAGLLLAPLVVRGQQPDASKHTPVTSEAPKLAPQQVRDAVSLVLEREATAKTPAERAAAIRDLSKLYVAICRDTDLARDQRLKLKAKVYSRLVSIKEDLEWNIKRHQEDPKAELPMYPVGESLSEQTPQPQGGGAVTDYGETLVELIQATISPASWDVNGGPASIVYYPNLKVLVVRASGDVHGHVGGLFDGLRRAGP
jgi:hypothetical protein